MRDADHLVADLRFLGRTLGAQADDRECGTDLAGGVASVLVDGSDRSRELTKIFWRTCVIEPTSRRLER